MIQMNLLPWRKTLNERKRKENLATISFAAGFAACLVILTILGLSMSIANEKIVVQYLNNKISSLDTNLQEIRGLETKKTNLIAKINVLQKLQIRRADTAKIFDELVAVIPDNITLSNLQRTGDRVAISGFADSNSDVSQFMKNIERSTLLDSARLLEIEQILINDAFINQFYMDFKIGSI
jgi:type IV pilus assembly protein PilN